MKKYHRPNSITFCVMQERALLVNSELSGGGDISGEGIDWEDDPSGDGSISGEGLNWMD